MSATNGRPATFQTIPQHGSGGLTQSQVEAITQRVLRLALEAIARGSSIPSTAIMGGGVTLADLTPYALDTDLATHAADTTAIHGITDTSVLLTTAHTAAADPHTQYLKEAEFAGGQATFSGDGSTVAFVISHGLASTPSMVSIVGGTADSDGRLRVAASSTQLTVTFVTAPVLGTNNVKLWWMARI